MHYVMNNMVWIGWMDFGSGPPRFEGDRLRFGDRDGCRDGPRGPLREFGGEKGGALANYQSAFRLTEEFGIAMVYPKYWTHPCPPDKEPVPYCRTSDPKLLGAKCRILRSLPTRTPVDYRDRPPKAHTKVYPTSTMRTLINYRRRPSVQAYPWRSHNTVEGG
ncbi:hypothetical protein AgCh_001273 [Apium graveolens]